MSEWINVKVKLPNEQQAVLACSLYEITTQCPIISIDMYVAWIKEYGKNNEPIWEYSQCCGCICNEKVTHWMPLPEPPKDE